MVCIAATTDTFSNIQVQWATAPLTPYRGPKHQVSKTLHTYKYCARALFGKSGNTGYGMYRCHYRHFCQYTGAVGPLGPCRGPKTHSCKKNSDTCKHSAREVCMASLETQKMYVFQTAPGMKRAKCHYRHATSSLPCMLDIAHQKLQSAPILLIY